MLDRIGQNEQNKEILTQGSALERIQTGKSNPYSAIDRGLLIDESSISNDAIALWERENDTRRFVQFVLADPEEDKAAEELVKKQGLDKVLSVDDDETLFELLNNDQFLKDLAL